MPDSFGRTAFDPSYDPTTDPSSQSYVKPPTAYGPNTPRPPGVDPKDPSTWPPGYIPPGTVTPVYGPNNPSGPAQGQPAFFAPGGAFGGAAKTPPTGGNIRDPQYARQLVDYYGSLPGADPSLKATPDYWVQKMVSGEFGDTESFAIDKMQNAWKAAPTSGAGTQGVNPSYLSSFGDQGDLNQQFGMHPPSFQAPGDFQAPTAQSILSDPSYTFARDQAIDAVSKNKAAQGLYNSGGTVYDLANLGSQFASQQYDNIYNRDIGKWNTDWSHALSSNSASLSDYQNARDSYYANQNNPFSKMTTISQLGYNAAANAG